MISSPMAVKCGLVLLVASVNAQMMADRKGYPAEALDWKMTKIGWTNASFCCVNGQIDDVAKSCGTASCIIGRLMEVPFQLLGCIFLAPCNLFGATPEHWYLYAQFTHPEDWQNKVKEPRSFIYEMHINPNLNRIWKSKGCLTMYDVKNKENPRTGREVCQFLKSFRPEEFPPCQDFVRKFYTKQAGFDVHPGEFGCMNLCGPVSWVCARGCHCATKGVPVDMVPCGEVLKTIDVEGNSVAGADWIKIGDQAQSLFHPSTRWVFGKKKGSYNFTFPTNHPWLIRVIYNTTDNTKQHTAAEKWLQENKYIEVTPVDPKPTETNEDTIVEDPDNVDDSTETPDSNPTPVVDSPVVESDSSSDSIEPIDETPLDIPTITPTPIAVPESGFGETEIIAILTIAVAFVVIIGFALQSQQDSSTEGKQEKGEDSTPAESPRTVTPGQDGRDSVSTMSSAAVSIV